MNPKKLACSVTIILFVALATLTRAAVSTSESQTVYNLDYGGLLVQVEAPAKAWPGDEINITIRTEASAKVHVDFIHANVSSLKEGRVEIPLLDTITFLQDVDLNPGMVNETGFQVIIPEDALPGLIYGMVWYEWYIKGTSPAPFEMLPQAFPATFIENKPYIELKEDYGALNSSHADLQANYTSLMVNYTELQERYQQFADNQNAQNNATGLMYVFIITTGIFVVTTILLLAKRPSTATW